MSLSDKEELEIRVKALEEALEKVKDELAARQSRFRTDLGPLVERKEELTRSVGELETKVNELEGELLMEKERYDLARADFQRAEQHSRDLS